MWKYRKQESADIRGICVVCKTNPQKKVSSQNKYRAICSQCDKRLNTSNTKRPRKRLRPHRRAVKEFCEACGFIPEHICQLDIDHIDGVHSNNADENLQTLCANCHRLKTYRQLWNY